MTIRIFYLRFYFLLLFLPLFGLVLFSFLSDSFIVFNFLWFFCTTDSLSTIWHDWGPSRFFFLTLVWTTYVFSNINYVKWFQLMTQNYLCSLIHSTIGILIDLRLVYPWDMIETLRSHLVFSIALFSTFYKKNSD